MENFHSSEKKASQDQWDKGQQKMEQIYAKGLGNYLKEQGVDISLSFNLKDRNCRCIDEGTPGGVHLAGSGILLDKNQALDFLRRAEVEGIYSHEGCGAAALAGKDAQEWAQEIAQVLGVEYKGHISSEEMNRPSEFHDARAVYYDLTGNFDYQPLSQVLPKGFIISRKYLDPEYALQELAVSIKIAFGDHGFEDKFTQDNPLLIVLVAKDKDQVNLLQKEIAGILGEFDQSRLKIDYLLQ